LSELNHLNAKLNHHPLPKTIKMAKTKATRIAAKKADNAETASKEVKMALSNLQANFNLWYKISEVLFPI
jgi:hypothetical protein